jgi:predicted component of type VI protein secretion system
MKRVRLQDMTVKQLVRRFTELAIEQDNAALGFDTKEVIRLFWLLAAISDELKSRDGDQRRALMPLFEHPNLQVRVKAAKATLALAPQAARDVLQAVVDSKQQPQALEAGMSLWNLETGVYKPT